MRLSGIIIVFIAVFVLVTSVGIHEEFTWTRITYRWPTNKSKTTSSPGVESLKGKNRPSLGKSDSIVFQGSTNAAAVASRPQNDTAPSYLDYKFENNIPVGANVWKDKLFITVPRRQPGIPSTLNYVYLNSPIKHNLPLIPYPNWRLNMYPPSESMQENLVSIYRIAIDPCDRLWAVDTGILESPGNFTRVKPPTIIAIDLNTDEIVHRYQIPEDRWRPKPGQVTVTVDVTKETCDDAYLYLPDLSAYDLTVYSLKQNKSWLVTNSYFNPVPKDAELFVGGYRFKWNDGIFSTELSDIKKDGYRDMYFHPMASTYVYKVSTKILRSEALATRPNNEDDFKVIGNRGGKFQTSSADIHKGTGIKFLSLVNQNALGCWNIKKPLNTTSIVQRNNNKMIYPSDVKIYNDKVYLLTNSMPVFVYGRLNYDEINFRVWSNTIEEATWNTKCV